MNSPMAFFTVPADFKKETLCHYHELNQRGADRVSETYGQLTHGKLSSSGRARHLLPDVGKRRLADYIAWSKEYGIAFHYIFNSTCLGNLEFTQTGRRKIKRFLDELYELGVRSVTVALPPLLEMLQRYYSKMELRASTLCDVDSPNKVRRFLEMGIRRVVVDNSVNRSFGVLKRMSALGCQLEVIVNSLCFSECLYQHYHQNQAAHYRKGQLEDFYFNRCLQYRARQPGNLLRMNWIRPEDLQYYEAISIRSFKIQGRQAVQSGSISQCVDAYMQRSYHGNLFDLLHCFPSSGKAPYDMANERLDGFLKPFAENDAFCTKDCDACGYCDRFAQRCLDIEQTERINKMLADHFMVCDAYCTQMDRLWKKTRTSRR